MHGEMRQKVMKCLLILITYFCILTAEENVIGHDQEMSKVFARQSDEDEEGAEDGDNDGTNNDQYEETDDWMLLSRLNQHYEQSGDLLLDNGTIMERKVVHYRYNSCSRRFQIFHVRCSDVRFAICCERKICCRLCQDTNNWTVCLNNSVPGYFSYDRNTTSHCRYKKK